MSQQVLIESWVINRTCNPGLILINDSIEHTLQYTLRCVRKNYQCTPHVVLSVCNSSSGVHFLNYPESLWDYGLAEQFDHCSKILVNDN